MNRRSLLDYLAENDDPDMGGHALQTAESLRRRLAELEARLNAAARVEEAVLQEQPLSSQIETILKRPQGQVVPKPTNQEAMPPVAAELQPLPERSADFAKFVEAVHLIGRAANRFLQEPPRQLPAAREPVGPSQDTLMLTAALKETLAAFQAMTSNLATAAGEIRRATEMPGPEARKIEQSGARRLPREDSELFRLQDDLEDLRERLAAVTRRRSRDSY